MSKINSRGFTLIELLIVIAIIAIIAGSVFVALDPLTRFQDARDTRRWSDITALLAAIKINQVDNKGSYISSVASLATETNFMITDGITTPCNVPSCAGVSPAPSACVDLAELVSKGYLGSVPVSPDGVGSWSPSYTGYVINKSGVGTIKIQACEAENTPGGISVVR